MADVGLGIEAHGRTVAAVQQALSAGSATLLAQLRGAGAERLRTDQVGVTPDTSRTDNTAERILGYTGQLRVSFRVPAEKLGDVLGMALANGANTVDSTVLAPRETEVEAARQGLAASAVRTALAEARAVAEAAGYRVAARAGDPGRSRRGDAAAAAAADVRRRPRGHAGAGGHRTRRQRGRRHRLGRDYHPARRRTSAAVTPSARSARTLPAPSRLASRRPAASSSSGWCA